MNKGGLFFNFLLNAIFAFVVGVLTFLIGRDDLGLETGSMWGAGFAGIASGCGSCLGYEFGKNDWSGRKWNIVAGLVGAVVGGGLAACIGIG